MTTYPLSSFFTRPDAADELENVLADDSKRIIIFLGPGGNGKTTLCTQLSSANPGKYSVYHEGTEGLAEMVGSNMLNNRKVLITANSLDGLLEGIKGHVVHMNKTFPPGRRNM